jgi:hypothetical protein
MLLVSLERHSSSLASPVDRRSRVRAFAHVMDSTGAPLPLLLQRSSSLLLGKFVPAVGYQAANNTNDVFGQRRSLSSSRVVFPSRALKASACSL